MKKITISFDFDSTLSEPWVQDLARIFILAGHDVYIVTSRCKGVNVDMYKVAEEVGIPRQKVVCTEGAYKAETLKVMGVDIHFDDMEDECDQINRETGCKALLVGFDMEFIKYLHKDRN